MRCRVTPDPDRALKGYGNYPIGVTTRDFLDPLPDECHPERASDGPEEDPDAEER